MSDRCIDTINHSRIKVSENGMTAIFLNENKSQCRVGRIDGCMVLNGIRADYFVSNNDVSVLIELKGCKIDHACDQLFAAAEHVNVRKHLTRKIGFLIVCSRVPTITTAVQLAEQKARRKFNAKFKVKCRYFLSDFSDFA